MASGAIRCLVLEGLCGVDRPPWAEDRPQGIAKKHWTSAEKAWRWRATHSCGYPSGGLHREQLCRSELALDARAASYENRSWQGQAAYTREVATNCRGQVRGYFVATVPSRRTVDPMTAATFLFGWNDGARRGFKIPPFWQASLLHEENGSRGAGASMRRRASPDASPSGVYDHGHGEQVGSDAHASQSIHPGLIATGMASSPPPHPSLTPSTARLRKREGGTAASEPAMESAGSKDQLVLTRSTAGLATLTEGAAAYVGAVARSSASALHLAELVAQYAWSAKTE